MRRSFVMAFVWQESSFNSNEAVSIALLRLLCVALAERLACCHSNSGRCFLIVLVIVASIHSGTHSLQAVAGVTPRQQLAKMHAGQQSVPLFGILNEGFYHANLSASIQDCENCKKLLSLAGMAAFRPLFGSSLAQP